MRRTQEPHHLPDGQISYALRQVCGGTSPFGEFRSIGERQRFFDRPDRKQTLLPFEVLAIDIERAKAISMDAVYTEAKALLKSGFRYWFNDDEIAELYRESEDSKCRP